MLDSPGVLRKFCSGARHAVSCTSDDEVMSLLKNNSFGLIITVPGEFLKLSRLVIIKRGTEL